MLRDSRAGRRAKSRAVQQRTQSAGEKKSVQSRQPLNNDHASFNAACNANTRLFKPPQVAWEEATSSFTMHRRREPMDKFRGIPLRRVFRKEGSAFTSCCGSTSLVLPHAELPRVALANLSHLQVQQTSPSSLQPSRSQAEGTA